MNKKFEEKISRFPEYMKTLTKDPPVPPSELKNISKKGMYVFYENGKAVYVGRAKNFRQRFGQHRRKSSGQESATFAFKIAKKDAEKAGVNMKIHGKKKTRKELQNDPVFSPIFSNAKKRVSEMQVQIVQVDDDIEQALFEVYAHLELNTEYNTFETH